MTTETVVLIAALVYGLALGSFTNVIIDRLPVALSEPNRFGELWETRPWREVLGGRSRCSACGIPIRPIDNVPVISYLALRGKCRGCGDPIGVFHPLVELAVPGLAMVAVWQIGLHPALIPTLWMVPVAVAVTVIDFRTLIVPTTIVWPAFAVSVVITVGIAVYLGEWQPLAGGAIGLAILAGPLFGIWWIHPRGMGFGDVRLAVLIGWNVGFVALLEMDGLVGALFLTLVCLTLAAALGIVVGVALQVGFGRPVPFGPTLMGGALICMMLAGPILDPFH